MFQQRMKFFPCGYFKNDGHRATYLINNLKVSQNKTILLSAQPLSKRLWKIILFGKIELQTAESLMLKAVNTLVK